MQVQIDLWQLIVACTGLICTFASVVWLFGTILVRQFKAQLDQRFQTIEEAKKSGDETMRLRLSEHAHEELEIAKQLRNFEKDFLIFQRELPDRYVRREDYIRGQSVIEAKLDALYNKMEAVLIRGAK